jgi:hypothetical protein
MRNTFTTRLSDETRHRARTSALPALESAIEDIGQATKPAAVSSNQSR